MYLILINIKIYKIIIDNNAITAPSKRLNVKQHEQRENIIQIECE